MQLQSMIMSFNGFDFFLYLEIQGAKNQYVNTDGLDAPHNQHQQQQTSQQHTTREVIRSIPCKNSIIFNIFRVYS